VILISLRLSVNDEAGVPFNCHFGTVRHKPVCFLSLRTYSGASFASKTESPIKSNNAEIFEDKVFGCKPTFIQQRIRFGAIGNFVRDKTGSVWPFRAAGC
jgi:hypothetical protein